MSLSDDKFIAPPDTFRQIGDICKPLLEGLKEQQAERLEREADALEIEAEWRRNFARIIREGSQS
jgi:hypothetical protein